MRRSSVKPVNVKWALKVQLPGDFKPGQPFLLPVMSICLSCVLSLTACTVLTVKEIHKQSMTEELQRQTGDFVKNREWEKAAETVDALEKETDGTQATRDLIQQVQDGLRTAAEERISSFEYVQALPFLRKALSLLPDERIAKRIRDLELTLAVPKVFANELPLNSVFTSGGLRWDRSFSLLPEKSNPAVEAGFLPGSVIRLKFISPFDLERMTFRLLSAKQKAVAAGEGFRLKAEGGTYTWFCFLGLPCTIKEEGMVLSFEATRKGAETFTFNQTFVPLHRDFPEETIKLSSELTALVTAPDKRKNEERKLVGEILSSFNPDAVFQTGLFSQPVTKGQNIITSYFGHRRIFLYSSGSKTFSVHDGIDLGVKKGTPVLSLGRGRVRLAREHIVSGNTVIVEHLPGVFSAYYHMSLLHVTEGEMIEQAREIGEVGSTGLSTAPHLHFSVFSGNCAVDPAYFFAHSPLY